VLAEAAGSRVWPRHVDQAVRKQEAAGADVQTLATLHKVGDALLQYQTETAPAPPPAAPPPAIVRANAPAIMAAPAAEAEPGFAPPVADINAGGLTGTGDYAEAGRAIGHYVHAIIARLIVTFLFILIGVGMGMSGNLDGLQTAAILGGLIGLILTGWQVWALFSYASHSPGHTDSRGTAQAAAVFTILAGLIDILGAFASGPAVGRARSGSGWSLLSLLLALIAILLVVSICRKIASAFNDGRLEQRARTVNTLIGLMIGDIAFMFLMGLMGAGVLILLLALAFFGLVIAAAVLYIILLFATKRLLMNAVRA